MVRGAQVPQVIYLHGLGSSPGSIKAQLVSRWCRELEIPVEMPSLSIPSFERLSVNAVIARVTELVAQLEPERPLVLAGSSFGGFSALHTFARLAEAERAKVRGLFLMAPVFYPWHHTRGLLSPEIERVWREQGTFPITESATGKDVPVHYRFIEELRTYVSDVVSLSVPTTIIHGTRDETVSHEQSIEFSSKQTAARLVLLDDDHQLVAHPERLRELFHEFVAEVV